MFSVSADPRNGFHRDSSQIFSSVSGFSVLITVSSDEDVEEVDEVEELAETPGTTNGTWFDVSQ